MEKEVTIKLKPLHLIRGFLFVILLTAVFYAGRWSVESPDVDFSGVTAAFTAKTDSEDAPKVEPKKTTVETPEEETAEETTAETTTEGNDATEGTQESGETVITSYSKVSILATAVNKQWYDTWGKVTQIGYIVTNSEKGTIKPSYLIMKMEKYDDIEKKINIPLSHRNIKAGEERSAMLNIPLGFAYSPATLGSDLSNVKITLELYDENDKQVATVTRAFDLKG